jgi:hypothetical protein
MKTLIGRIDKQIKELYDLNSFYNKKSTFLYLKTWTDKMNLYRRVIYKYFSRVIGSRLR